MPKFVPALSFYVPIEGETRTSRHLVEVTVWKTRRALHHARAQHGATPQRLKRSHAYFEPGDPGRVVGSLHFYRSGLARDPGLIAHEAVHAVEEYRRRVKRTADEEALAYGVQFIVKRVWARIVKWELRERRTPFS